ncbi:hypothetical protein [Vitiosangium sp. GDMCC 1.1324]|uniref:hypothetical protein n=1 Tax=Vitiosangium sp. (strain GDMCC 1.1324) TaxID=2138576 RepID=UPI000D36F09E|nr:hypothetical protein [Vitiosangium sp. GDMCC 1.1324]PTL83473.1 hypothetical protein DAT35_16025 [Vitiosangium sp. GDMCC 1.1324]
MGNEPHDKARPEHRPTGDSQELTGQEEASGLPLTFYEHLMAASVDEKLVLAREAARHPGFDEEDAFEVASRVEQALEDSGRYAEFEGLLDAWKELAPRVHDAEPAVRTWRVELALRLPGRDLKGALVSLARHTGDAALVSRLAEWCLFRGRLEEARAGLLEAWPRVREDESLAEWTRMDYVTRAVLTCMDAELRDSPDLSLDQLNEQLSVFARAVPHWVGLGLGLRTGREPWPRRTGKEVLDLPPEEFFDEQRALVLAFEPELRMRQGWPWGRTQLLFPELFRLLPGPFGHHGKVQRAMHLLLPVLSDLEHWVRGMAEERALHPHAHAATALALRPWGEFLHGRGLVDASELAEWWEQAWQLLSALPEQFAASGDPLLVEEVHRLLRGGWPHG